MISDADIERFNKHLNGLSVEELEERNKQGYEQNEKDFQALKAALVQNTCYYCDNPISHFSDKKPCLHWLLKPKGFKKRHFPLLFAEKNFHQIQAYTRWVANCDVPIKNINDLVAEKASSKYIEETIRYRNIEWSFSCSHGDRVGHKDRFEGKMPHYHFQMTVDGNVVINYNGFHIPFDEEDEFLFAIQDNKFDRLKGGHIHGAGMQTMFDRMSPDELVENMIKTDNEDDAQFHVGITIEANEGTTISGNEIAELLKERNRTGVSMAKLSQRLKNVKVQTTISPGPGVPDIAARKKNR